LYQFQEVEIVASQKTTVDFTSNTDPNFSPDTSIEANVVLQSALYACYADDNEPQSIGRPGRWGGEQGSNSVLPELPPFISCSPSLLQTLTQLIISGILFRD
jgi:hypothetical protein